MSVLIWVQTVCKGYQQVTKVAASKERVNSISMFFMASITTTCIMLYLMTDLHYCWCYYPISLCMIWQKPSEWLSLYGVSAVNYLDFDLDRPALMLLLLLLAWYCTIWQASINSTATSILSLWQASFNVTSANIMLDRPVWIKLSLTSSFDRPIYMLL